MNGNAALLWLVLDNEADTEGFVAISLAEMGRRTGVHQKTVISAIRYLMATGCVERLERGSHHAPSRYRVVKRPELLSRRAA